MEDQKAATTAGVATNALVMNGGAFGWEPGDDICPSWWPRRPPKGTGWIRKGEVSRDLLAVDRIYSALTLMATTFQMSDEEMARDARRFAANNVRAAAGALAEGASVAWEPGDDICPPPYKRKRKVPPAPPWWISALMGDPDPVPWKAADLVELPSLAVRMLDLTSLVNAYNVAAKTRDNTARRSATAALGQAVANAATQLVEHIG